MSPADEAAITQANKLAERRFRLELKRDEEVARFKSAEAELKAQHKKNLARIDVQIEATGSDLWQLMDQSKPNLVERGKQSFVTLVAKFQFRKLGGKTTVLDKPGIMQVARRLGVVRKIADPPQFEWKFNQRKFLAWLNANPKLRQQFDEFLTDEPASESLTIQPNGTYTVHHNSQRISPPSVSIKKS